MNRDTSAGIEALRSLARQLDAAGASFTIEAPGTEPIHLGTVSHQALVRFNTPESLRPLGRRDHLGLAEAYLRGEIDIEGAFSALMPVTDLIRPNPSVAERIAALGRLLLMRRTRVNRDSISFHYDRPADFFLPWFERWRSYSHGFYEHPEDSAERAQARKMQFAIDALGLKPGAHVLDMGGGWGCFVEYAGLQGIHVHAITISKEQYTFVSKLISEKSLPCTIEFVDFLEYRPTRRFDGAVFMGTLEHVPDYAYVAAFLSQHLEAGASVYADFCAARDGTVVGSFMRKYLWSGVTGYVDVARLTNALIPSGFNIHELACDTASYAYTVRDWARGLEREREQLAARFSESEVRAFLLFLWASEYFLLQNKTQAYHLVASHSIASAERRATWRPA